MPKSFGTQMIRTSQGLSRWTLCPYCTLPCNLVLDELLVLILTYVRHKVHSLRGARLLCAKNGRVSPLGKPCWVRWVFYFARINTHYVPQAM